MVYYQITVVSDLVYLSLDVFKDGLDDRWSRQLAFYPQHHLSSSLLPEGGGHQPSIEKMRRCQTDATNTTDGRDVVMSEYQVPVG